jgi:hypothetical protein
MYVYEKELSGWKVMQGLSVSFSPVFTTSSINSLEEAKQVCLNKKYGGFTTQVTTTTTTTTTYSFYSQRPVHLADSSCYVLSEASVLHVAPQLKHVSRSYGVEEAVSTSSFSSSSSSLHGVPPLLDIVNGSNSKRPVYCYGNDFGPLGTPHDYNFCINGLVQVLKLDEYEHNYIKK